MSSRKILVAGDVCLDVVAVPVPAKPPGRESENWRMTGETRTHFLPGGAMLLAEFIRAPLPGPETQPVAAAGAVKPGTVDVIGPCPLKPSGIADGPAGRLDLAGFLSIAERLRRDEIVHSLIAADRFPATSEPKEKRKALRVAHEHGYSGPTAGNPSIAIEYPDAADARIVVLDDTGNRFRLGEPGNPWPASLTPSAARPLIVYKLHRPLPGPGAVNALWNAVSRDHARSRIVVVSVGDLRIAGAPISLGLSWERTALDVVWHLLNVEAFAGLRDCPWLIVRLGLDGAVLWRRTKEPDAAGCPYEARLVYDPAGIEGSFALRFSGHMVSCGSAFTAGLVRHIAGSDETALSALVGTREDEEAVDHAREELQEAVKAGLLAARRLLKIGFGVDEAHPAYPGAELFQPAGKDDAGFSSRPIPIIVDALEPDRGGWRLLEDIFSGQTGLLHRAVAQVATGSRPCETPGDPTFNKLECDAAALLGEVPVAVFGALRTYDRREIEHYRALHTLLTDYLESAEPPRPLSLAVYGPPGAGKSFGIKEVAVSLKGRPGCRVVKPITFNLSLYQTPEELAGAFHLVRDISLKGEVPLVFFDEFDTSLGDRPLGWLRYFLSPMQDGEFLDRGAPHPIGPAIFVFAGGTCATFQEFARHPALDDAGFKAVKGPDFLSRLRATLDIPSLNFITAQAPVPVADPPPGRVVQPPDTFDPYGPIEAFPCDAAVLLRRAGILAFNLKRKAPRLVRPDGSLALDTAVLRALLHMPRFEHGNRSFEALLDMSHLSGADTYTPSLLPAPFQLPLHASAVHLQQLVATDYPFPQPERLKIAQAIHRNYQECKRKDPNHDPAHRSLRDWDAADSSLALAPDHKESNLEQADDIARKLRSVGLWFRKRPIASAGGSSSVAERVLESSIETIARLEHDRWVAERRRKGWIPGSSTDDACRDDKRLLHNCLFPWDELSPAQRALDCAPVRNIPLFLATAGYEVVQP